MKKICLNSRFARLLTWLGVLAVAVLGSGLVVGFNLTPSLAFAQVLPPVTIAPLMSPPPAQEIMLTAIPPRLGDDFKLKAKPGEKIQTVIRVRNSSAQAVTITSAVEDFVIDVDGKTPIPVKETVSSRWSLAKWTTISPADQVIPAGKSANVNLIIDVPADALPGGHYAMVLHQPQPNGTKTGSQTSIGQRVGTLVYFVVDGPINEEAFLRNFAFPQFTEYGPVPFTFAVENMSDIHIKPQLGVEIYNVFGKKVDHFTLESFNVFPFVARNFAGSWDRTWGIGPYTAKLVMSYGEQGQVATIQARFWLLPIKLVIASILALLSVMGIGIAIRRHLIHRQQLAQQKIKILEKKVAELEKENQPPRQ